MQVKVLEFRHQLPEYFRLALPQEVLASDRQESKATCHDCAMSRKNRGPRAHITYQPHLKCCTFQPFVPNFAVGALLKNAAQFVLVQQTLQNMIQKRQYVLPLGILPSVRYQAQFQKRKPNDFGQKEEWLCPYYQVQTQNCGIWKFRGSVCSTFFCKSDEGARGLSFWSELLNYLSYVEMALVEDFLAELDFSPRQVSELLEYHNRKKATVQELKSDSLPIEKFKRLWNGYDQEIESFFLKCYEKSQNLNRKNLDELLGEHGQMLRDRMLKKFARLSMN